MNKYGSLNLFVCGFALSTGIYVIREDLVLGMFLLTAAVANGLIGWAKTDD